MKQDDEFRGSWAGVFVILAVLFYTVLAVWAISKLTASPMPKRHPTVPRAPAGHRHTSTCNQGSHRWTPREVRCVIRIIFRRGGADSTLRVGSCESGLDAYEVNRSSGASGWAQVIPRWHPDAPSPFNVVAITKWVRGVTRNGTDWSQWVCQP